MSGMQSPPKTTSCSAASSSRSSRLCGSLSEDRSARLMARSSQRDKTARCMFSQLQQLVA